MPNSHDIIDFGKNRTLKEALGLFFIYSLPFLAIFAVTKILGF